MFRNASTIKGYAIAASDGHLGTASDFLFDDQTWLVRWLVVDTGHWLPGRKVLLPLSVLVHLDLETQEFTVRPSKQQVKDSPTYDPTSAVDRAYEKHFYDYYGDIPVNANDQR
jgi:hypothetical protein